MKLSDTHGERRQKLFGAIEKVARYHADQQESRGEAVSLPSYESMVQEAEQLAFGKELKAQETRSRGQRLRRQSNKRRGVGTPNRGADASAAQKEPATEFEQAAAIALDPDIVAFTTQ